MQTDFISAECQPLSSKGLNRESRVLFANLDWETGWKQFRLVEVGGAGKGFEVQWCYGRTGPVDQYNLASSHLSLNLKSILDRCTVHAVAVAKTISPEVMRIAEKSAKGSLLREIFVAQGLMQPVVEVPRKPRTRAPAVRKGEAVRAVERSLVAQRGFELL